MSLIRTSNQLMRASRLERRRGAGQAGANFVPTSPCTRCCTTLVRRPPSMNCRQEVVGRRNVLRAHQANIPVANAFPPTRHSSGCLRQGQRAPAALCGDRNATGNSLARDVFRQMRREAVRESGMAAMMLASIELIRRVRSTITAVWALVRQRPGVQQRDRLRKRSNNKVLRLVRRLDKPLNPWLPAVMAATSRRFKVFIPSRTLSAKKRMFENSTTTHDSDTMRFRISRTVFPTTYSSTSWWNTTKSLCSGITIVLMDQHFETRS